MNLAFIFYSRLHFFRFYLYYLFLKMEIKITALVSGAVFGCGGLKDFWENGKIRIRGVKSLSGKVYSADCFLVGSGF